MTKKEQESTVCGQPGESTLEFPAAVPAGLVTGLCILTLILPAISLTYMTVHCFDGTRRSRTFRIVQ